MAANRTALFLVFVTVFIDLLGFGIVLPLLPRYGDAFDAGPVALGVLMAVFSAMQFVFAPIWGLISDHVGRRPILLLGLAGSTLSYLLFGYATSLGSSGVILGFSALTWLFVSRIGAGIAGATINTAQAYIADVTDEKGRGKGMALIGAAFGIGFTFGPLIGAAFVSDDAGAPPSGMPGYVAAGLSGLAFLFALARLPESRQFGATPSTHGHRMNLGGIGRALTSPTTGLVLLMIFLATFSFAQFESTLSLLTKELGLADRRNFLVFAYIGFVLAVTQGGLVRRLLPRFGEYKVAVAGTAVMVLGLALTGMAASLGSVVTLFAVLPILVVGYSAVNPALQAMLSLRTDESRQGEVLGVGQSVSSLSRILGPLVGIVLFKATGVTVPFYSGAALMLVGLALVSSLRGSDRADREHEVQPAVAEDAAG